MQNIIQLQHVQKKIKDQIIVKNLDFSVKKGEIFGFLGPSGAGKTTTINMMTGLFKVSKGSLKVLGYNASKLGTSQFMHDIGIMTDHSSLYHRLTIYENLKLFSNIYQMPKQRIDEVLENVELNDHRNKRISELSSGMKQRVLLARAIIHKPKLLFLDEPTANLDPITSKLIHSRLKEINEQGTTVFITTHDMDEAAQLCHRVAFIINGEIKLIGHPQSLQYQYATPTIKIVTKDDIHYTLDINSDTGALIHKLITNDNLKYIASDIPSLGDIFVKVTGEELKSNEII